MRQITLRVTTYPATHIQQNSTSFLIKHISAFLIPRTVQKSPGKRTSINLKTIRELFISTFQPLKQLHARARASVHRERSIFKRISIYPVYGALWPAAPLSDRSFHLGGHRERPSGRYKSRATSDPGILGVATSSVRRGRENRLLSWWTLIITHANEPYEDESQRVTSTVFTSPYRKYVSRPRIAELF